MNNGSAMSGLNGNTPYYNVVLGISMWLGRFGVVIPVLALAGSVARQRWIRPGAGTLATDGALFRSLLSGVILIVGGLSLVVTLTLALIAEHLSLATRVGH